MSEGHNFTFGLRRIFHYFKKNSFCSYGTIPIARLTMKCYNYTK